MTSEREQIVRAVWQEARRIIVISRQMASEQPPGLVKARLKQLAEYAELVLSSYCQGDRRPPMFAGWLDDDDGTT
jgi:hypothetical protein